ncbi:hypothetical protein [Halosolutus halophilus]|uniref:hypothetical protein n=1 Tax=Halosolutus halophilus TaxID=1552990 RepID=UPI0022352079|nr:hypothetical protein [Halosolutus halophilus]
MASALVTGNVTLITVVVAINQVILSQELESPGALRDEIERTAEYRQTALNQEMIPTHPSDFLYQLLQQTRQHALSLEDFLPKTTDEVSDPLLTDLPSHCKQVSDQMESTSDDLSAVIVPILGITYSDYIHDCHLLQAKFDEDDHERLHMTLDRLTSDLENIDVARQYFTTTFMKEELATLSQSLLYIGIFAISVPIALLVQLTTYTGSSPPTSELFLLSVLTVVFGLLPLAVLIAFVLRIATVAQEIAAITPFTS